MKFCPRCGKKNVELIDGFCKDCNKEHYKLQVKDVKIKICTECHKYIYHNKWSKYKALHQLIKKQVKLCVRDKVENIAIEIPRHRVNPGIDIEAQAIVVVKGNEYLIPVSVSYTLCKICSKGTGNYFEGILQLRNPNQKVEDYIKKRIMAEDGVFATKIETVRGGIDYYLTNSKFIMRFGNELAKKFSAQTKMSRKLYSRNKATSKEVWRFNFLVKLLDYKVGDIVTCNGEEYKVREIGKRILLGRVSDGKREVVDYDEIRIEKKKKVKVRKK